MGTTIVGLYMEKESIAHIAHVGDSRAYLIRENTLNQITTDHSWVNEQIQKNILTQKDARNHRWKNVITRALGNKLNVEIDLNSIEIFPNDNILLCTDGLSSMIDDTSILKILEEKNDKPEKTCKNLIQMANEKGGLDNITVVLLKFAQ